MGHGAVPGGLHLEPHVHQLFIYIKVIHIDVLEVIFYEAWSDSCEHLEVASFL